MLGWFKSKRAVVAGRLGIEVQPQGIALAHVQRDPGEPPRLLGCAYQPTSEADVADTLKRMVQEMGVAGLPVNFLPQPADYQIFLLECPEVPADELRSAMRWRVKDIILQPLDDVVVDCFPLPDDAYRGRTRMAYCAVLTKARMQAAATLVEQAGLRLASIDIAEMVLRNLGAQAGADGVNVAVLQLQANEGLICIHNGSDIYMARRIEQGLARRDDDLSGVTLEIQRSLDYFESQLGKGYITRMLLLPMEQDTPQVHAALSRGLAVNLMPLEVRNLFPAQPAAELTEAEQATCIGAIGAALRQDAS